MGERRIVLPLLIVSLVLVLGGCSGSTEQSGDSATGEREIGGYAGEMAAPPSTGYAVSDAELQANIDAGLATDSKAPPPEPTEEEKKAVEAQLKEAAKRAAEIKANKGKPVVPTANKSGDKAWVGNAKPVAAFQTRRGVAYFELWPEAAPKTVKAISKLVRDKFYDGLYVHRVEPDFVVQFGCPFTKDGNVEDPRVGTGDAGFKIPDEFSQSLKHVRGTLAMAHSAAPNSQGSQMYVVLAPAPFLDGKYTIFGRVLGDGMDVIDAIRKGDQIESMWMVKDLPADQR